MKAGSQSSISEMYYYAQLTPCRKGCGDYTLSMSRRPKLERNSKNSRTEAGTALAPGQQLPTASAHLAKPKICMHLHNT